MKVTGLDKLQKTLRDAEVAMNELDGEIGKVSFDPNDPADIERAIGEFDHSVDEKVGRYASNSIVAALIPQLKEKCREFVLTKAAEERLKSK